MMLSRACKCWGSRISESTGRPYDLETLLQGLRFGKNLKVFFWLSSSLSPPGIILHPHAPAGRTPYQSCHKRAAGKGVAAHLTTERITLT